MPKNATANVVACKQTMIQDQFNHSLLLDTIEKFAETSDSNQNGMKKCVCVCCKQFSLNGNEKQ